MTSKAPLVLVQNRSASETKGEESLRLRISQTSPILIRTKTKSFLDAGEVEVVDVMPPSSPPPLVEEGTTDQTPSKDKDLRTEKLADIKASFKGYEDPIRKRFKMEADNRPKISLWVNTPWDRCSTSH